MTKTYIQPEVQISQLTTMTLMQAASPAGSASGSDQLNAIETDDQW